MKKTIFFFILIILFSFLIQFSNKDYDIKIEIPFPYKNAKYIDETYAKKIEDELFKLNNIKDLIIISSSFNCNIYIKRKFFSSKNILLNQIERKLNSLEIKNYKTNENYNYKYNYFIVVQTKSDDYDLLKNKADEIQELLLKKNLAKDIQMLGKQQKVNYIYYSENELLKYNLDLEDIKSLIRENNSKKDFEIKKLNKYNLGLNFNSAFKNIADLKNTPIFFQNSNFTTTFENVFEIQKDTKKPQNQKIIYNNKNAIVLALSKQFYFPKFVLNFLLKDYNVVIINPKFKRKIEIFSDENSNPNSLSNLINNQKGLFFFGITPPKIDNQETFDEIKSNRVIGFVDYFDKINLPIENEYTIAPTKITGINYKINTKRINDFKLNKKEIINTFLANSDGLICDYYFIKNDKVEIILKKKKQKNASLIYSKNLKTLVSQDAISNSNFETFYNSIARKNFKYITIKKLKNPLFFKGAQLQIRYLLSL